MKTIQIYFSLILVSITFNAFCQSKENVETPVFLNPTEMVLASNELTTKTNVSILDLYESDEIYSHDLDSDQSLPQSVYQEDNEILEISKPYKCEVPEMIFEPALHVESRMITALDLPEKGK